MCLPISTPLILQRRSTTIRNGKPSRTKPFKTLVLHREAIHGAGLFRVKGAGLRMFCTDKKGGLYDRVKELNLTGLNFKEVLVSDRSKLGI